MRLFQVALFLFSSLAVRAQLLPTRAMPFPVGVPRETGTGFLARLIFFGDLQRGAGSAGDDRAWEAVLGGATELYRWDSSMALEARVAQSLLANDDNDIHFNPRSAWWEENLVLTWHGAFDAQAGLSYRCKHDIDNSDPYNSDVPRDSGPAEKRVLILGGVFGTIAPAPVHLGAALTLQPVVRTDFYLLREDNRFPANAGGLDWSRAWNSTSIAVRLTWACGPATALYMRDAVTGVFATAGAVRAGADGRIEGGVRFAGVAGAVEAFVAWEHLFDDFSIPEPRATSVTALGVRVTP